MSKERKVTLTDNSCFLSLLTSPQILCRISEAFHLGRSSASRADGRGRGRGLPDGQRDEGGSAREESGEHARKAELVQCRLSQDCYGSIDASMHGEKC